MNKVLPVRSNPWALCDSSKCFTGHIPLARFARLEPFLISTEGEAVFTLSFVRNGRQGRIQGQISAALELTCQRCLKSLPFAVETELDLILVSSYDEMALLPDNTDPLLVDYDELISIQDLIEDELLLLMPQSPVHTEADCTTEYNNLSAEIAGAEDTDKNPFGILAQLQNSKQKS